MSARRLKICETIIVSGDLTKSIRLFTKNIDTVNRLNNDPVQPLIDKDNLYIGVQSEE